MSYADKDDVAAAYEGNLDTVNEGRVQYMLDVALARLNKLIPTLSERTATDTDLLILAKDVVVQAVLRQIRNPSPEFVQQTQSAGPFGLSVNTGSGNSRGSRGLFYDEELELLREFGTGSRMGTIKLGLSDWSA